MMMRGDSKLEKVHVVGVGPGMQEVLISGERALEVTGAVDVRKREGQQNASKIEAFGLDIMKEEGGTE